jgi:hypothetical protein
MHDQSIQLDNIIPLGLFYSIYFYRMEDLYEIDAFLVLRPQIGQMTGKFGGSREEG